MKKIKMFIEWLFTPVDNKYVDPYLEQWSGICHFI